MTSVEIRDGVDRTTVRSALFLILQNCQNYPGVEHVQDSPKQIEKLHGASAELIWHTAGEVGMPEAYTRAVLQLLALPLQTPEWMKAPEKEVDTDVAKTA